MPRAPVGRCTWSPHVGATRAASTRPTYPGGPSGKAAHTTWWSDTTLCVDLGLTQLHTDAWTRRWTGSSRAQPAIEATLVRRHLAEGSLLCYDLSSSFVEGAHNELAAFGHSRDGKRAKRQVEYGVVATREGLPVTIEVFPGNTSDPKGFVEIVWVTKARFGLSRVVFVGDRGMITSARIAALKEAGGFGWVTALRAPEVNALLRGGAVQPSLFDKQNLCEIAHPDYESERLVACKNPFLAAGRAREREALLRATAADLAKVVVSVSSGRLRDPGKIGLRAGRVLNRHKMGKHFDVEIVDGHFSLARKQDAIAEEARLDDIHVIRTSETDDALSPGALVETYTSLTHIERDFRTMKSVDLRIRPIRHRLADPVRAPAFICLLPAHLVFNLRAAWAPLTFQDEQPSRREEPVLPAVRARSASAKARRQRDGSRAPFVPGTARPPGDPHARHLHRSWHDRLVRAPHGADRDPAASLQANRSSDPAPPRVVSNERPPVAIIPGQHGEVLRRGRDLQLMVAHDAFHYWPSTDRTNDRKRSLTQTSASRVSSLLILGWR